MSTVNITNASNGNIFVALAHLQGDLVSEGWFEISQGQTRSFALDDSLGLCVRVQGASGNEINFNNFNTPFFFTLHTTARFSVSKVPGDPTDVRVLRSGANLENVQNVIQNAPLPNGWANERFFAVGPGTFNEFVNP